MAKRGEGLLKACDPFARVAIIVDRLPDRLPDDTPARDVMPGIWPTLGELRRLRDELVATGWSQ